MKIRGYYVEMMCQVTPEYKQHVKYENGNKVMYIIVLRVIYGCIQSVLLWYKLFLNHT